MSRSVILPVQDVYSVSDLVKYLGYTRQSISKAIHEVCPNAEKGTRGYRLTADNARAIAANFSIVVEIENEPRAKEEKQNQKQAETLIELLKEQIKAKDAQIAALNEQFASIGEQNARLIEIIDDLTDTSKALATNATMHTAKDIKQEQEQNEPLSIVPQNQNKTFLQKLRELFS